MVPTLVENSKFFCVLVEYTTIAKLLLKYFSIYNDVFVGICLCHVKVIVHNRSLFTDFIFVYGEER